MKKQELAVASILERTEQLLRLGRPRKMPGKPRPVAITPWKSSVSYLSANAVQYSLHGAIMAAAYSLRLDVRPATLSRARHIAEGAIRDEINNFHGYQISQCWQADEKIADTRLIQRAVKKAVKSYA